MRHDVFYYGTKPNAHPKEKQAQSLTHARELATTDHFWIINEFCNYSKFDWEWEFDFLSSEDIWAEEHNNVWPSQHQKDSGTWLCPKEFSEIIIYRCDVDPIIRKNEKNTCWVLLEKIDEHKFDFSWHPDASSPPYIYAWGNKFTPAEEKSTIEYHVFGATEYNYMDAIIEVEPHDVFYYGTKPNAHPKEKQAQSLTHARELATTDHFWIINEFCNYSKFKWEFDFSWHPDASSPPYIYAWGNKFTPAEEKSTIEYHVFGATEYNYMDAIIEVEPDMQYWTISNEEDLKTFDFSWRPNPYSPPQIYQWANNGPCYSPPNATEVVLVQDDIKRIVHRYIITTTLEDLINEHPDEVFWVINPDLTYSKFDFNWKPSEENFRHINVFGNEDSKDIQTYYINGPMYKLGHHQYNYIEDIIVTGESILDMFYIEKNSRSKDRYEELKQRYPNLQKTRYLNSWAETITRCCTKSKTKLFWVLNSEIDYSNFDFDFYPNLWQMEMVHMFGTQWTHWGNTYLINSVTFLEKTKHIKVLEHLNIINFVKTKRTRAVEKLYETVLIDYGNDHTIEAEYTVEYEHSYINTFKKILEILPVTREHYVWVCSSICDYSNFDFTYICDPYSTEQLHVFPSDNQKFGDTFLVNVNKLRILITQMKKLEEYEKINYNQHQRVRRLPAPVINVTEDTHCASLNVEYDFPYAIFQTEDIPLVDNEPINLWESETKIIKILSAGATQIIVPKEAKEYVKKELYDYPYIKRADKLTKSKPLDIVFFSNGEAIADKNYEHLLHVTKNLPNKVIRIDGVNGRVQSQHAAAASSNTAWYFLVNAKLKVAEKFDFSWQPDRLQIPKHYIFHATNPVNGLIYGHQAIVANNKRLTLANYGTGLDFTMDSEHEVVEINSGIAIYNASAWDTWRTSFRECIKLNASYSPENKERLQAWLSIGIGEFAQYSISGARHAMTYYEEVNGDFDKLRLSYDWAWIRTLYEESTKSN